MAGFSINTVVISGNLTRDPELRTLPNGTAVCEIGVAVNERIKDPSGQWTDRPNYFDVTIWSGMGEYIARSCHKGDGITVEGRLRWESWEKDGQTRSKVKIVANSVVPRKDGGGGGGQGGGGFSGRSDIPVDTDDFRPAPTPVSTGGGTYGGGGGGNGGGYPSSTGDDDIPF